MIKAMQIKYSVHDMKSNPIFGDLITHVTLEDEAAGCFIILEQPTSEEPNLRFELDELKEIVRVSEKMINQYQEGGYDSN